MESNEGQTEPELPEAGFNGEHGPRWRRIPLFLHLRALKPGVY